MKVSFIIVAYNEENTLKQAFDSINNQDYPHNLIEIILVDGMSTDDTKKIMMHFKQYENEYSRIVIKDNPKKTLPCGWNIALKEATGDVIIRIDAHATIPNDFISKNVECIKSGEDICGGYRQNIIDEETPWKKTLLSAETSMFGSSIAPYRRNKGTSYVKSVFHGAYKKEVFNKVGYYNELLARTEDNEMHYRMRKAGYKICFNPKIKSYQHTRNSLAKMLKQKYSNGYWIGLTLSVEPKCFSIYHFIPLFFVISIIGTLFLAILGYKTLFYMLCIMYTFINLLLTTMSIKKGDRSIVNLMIPLIFLCMHVSYGLGTLIGILSITKFRKKINLQEGK